MKKILYAFVLLFSVILVSCESECESELSSQLGPDAHPYVDLGLSVKWATCNVGADSPEDCGDYFAWGETEPKEKYNWSTYKWCNGSYDSQTKYTVGNKTELDLEDDAARANWGGSWRMPTAAEIYELCIECTWTWTVQNGVNGYKVTSKTNGNSIFLPATGNYQYSDLEMAGSRGYYWSSSLNTAYEWLAGVLYFRSNKVAESNSYRRWGMSVRPVLP